jgi:hypothetical protein
LTVRFRRKQANGWPGSDCWRTNRAEIMRLNFILGLEWNWWEGYGDTEIGRNGE